MSNYNPKYNSKHPDIRKLQQGICPNCNIKSLRNINGKMDVDHLSDCGRYIFYRKYTGFECERCKLTNKTYTLVRE